MTGLYETGGGELLIGRMEPCQIVCRDCQEMSGQHVVIRNSSTNKRANANSSDKYELIMEGKNGGYVNKCFIRRGDIIDIQFGDEISICDVYIIWMEDYIAVKSDKSLDISLPVYHYRELDITAYLKPDFFSKAPRPQYALDDNVIELEPPPEKHVDENQPIFMTIGPAFTMAFPMLLGFLVSRMAAKSSGVMSSAFMYTGLITAISSAAIGAAWGVMNLKNRQANVVRQENKRRTAYTEYVLESERRIRERNNKNVSTLRMKYPDISDFFPDEYNKYILWNRSPNDSDYLCVRLGIGNIYRELDLSIPKDRFSLVEDELRNLPKRLKQKYSVLKDVPIIIDLAAQKCSGIVCESRKARDDIFLELIISLGATIHPAELKFVFIFDKEEISNEAIMAVRFIPHLSHISKALIALNTAMAAEIISDLNQILEDDLDFRAIIFTDCYEKIINRISNSDRIMFVSVSESFEGLPSDCKLIIQKNHSFSGTIKLTYENAIRTAIHFDKVSVESASKYSRVLQSIPIESKKDKYSMPDKVSFYELFNKVLDAEDIKEFWDKNTTTHEILAPVGIGDDGEILYLNLHEKGIGPHGLVAGMTGSGKSEILQTIILSLTVRYSPQDIGFFLIDYKGGGMADLFEGIPHVLGSISNLSGQMIYRAMASVKSENERRQRIFAKYGVNNISEYQKCFKSGLIDNPMPHIFIIIDEFAELKREEPEFMKELISVARVGRSLGVHLILATQKPSGVVDDNIQSNSRFRICLKLQDKSDSMEMLHKPDAAFISNPGRAILQVGNDEVYMSFQGAYTMSKNNNIKHIEQVYITDELNRRIEPAIDFTKDEMEGEPQLKMVVSRIKELAKTYKCKSNTPLWLEPLADNIFYDKDCLDSKNKFDICIGVYDAPSHQTQEKLWTNIINTGHHIVLGTLQSGKSTLLSTISFALVNIAARDFIHLYFIDFSHGMLSPYKEAFCTGGYISEENENDIEKLLILIGGIVNERKEQLKGGNFRQYLEGSKGSGRRLAAIFLIVDGFGAFRERTEGRYDKDIEYILKNGESLGIYVIASANSISSQEMPRRFKELFKVCIPLQLKDKYEYKEALNVQTESVIIPEATPGRGVFNHTNAGVVEFQTYQTVKTENDFERQAAIAEVIRKINESAVIEHLNLKGGTAYIKRVPTIPRNLDMKAFASELKRRDIDADIHMGLIPIGFFERSGEVLSLPYERNFIVVITGRSGSGRTNLLNVIEYMAGELVTSKENNPEALVFENGMKVYVYDDKYPLDKQAEIKANAGNDPYVIHLGGAMDRQVFADYSYVPYSKQIQVIQSGKGVVRKTSRALAYGDVIFPKI